MRGTGRREMTTRRSLVAAAAVLIFLARPAAQSPNSWRPTIVAQHGMVAAGHPLAAEAGLRILKAGGNAIDAAIATWAVQGEVEPGMTGLGADMFILYYEAKTGQVRFINGTGFAPQAATIDFYKSKGGLPDSGPLAISVPGAIGGAAFAVKKYGSKPLADVLAPAIEIADQGFPITESLARGLAGSKDKLEKWPSTTKIWFRNGKPLGTGDVLLNPALARTLRAIATQGPDAFYRGDIAKNTAAYLKANGGIITEADLRSYEPFEDAPIRINYRGTDVYECPPNSQGFVMLEALNILEGFDLRAMGHNSAPYLHAVAGEPAPGDPLHIKPATAGQVYAAPRAAPSAVSPFDPDAILNLTTYLAVVDKDHNMVSITSSLLSGFGSGMVVEHGGFFMNDRMKYFYLDPKNV